MDQRSGEERRSDGTCHRHEDFIVLVTTLTTHMDTVLENQKEIFAKINGNTSELVDVKRIVSNGMSEKIKSACEDMKNLCSLIHEFHDKDTYAHQEIHNRLAVLEEFSWFRTAITKVRDNIFWYTIKGLFVLVLVLAVISFTNEVIKDLVLKLISIFK